MKILIGCIPGVIIMYFAGILEKMVKDVLTTEIPLCYAAIEYD